MNPTTGLIERTAQLSMMEGLLDDCAVGRGRVALLRGPIASGKTELLHAFAARANRRGFGFVSATCSPYERTLPFGAAIELFRQLSWPAASEGHVETLRHADSVVCEQKVAYVLQCLSLAVLDLAAESPLMLGLDDFQHADPLSQQWLASLVRRLGSAKVLLVATETVTGRQAHSALHTELFRHPHCHLVTVEPLSPGGVAAMVGGDRADQAYELTGGNPLLVRSLLDDRPGDGAEIRPGPRFRQALLSCLDRGEPGVQLVARALAVLGEHAGADSAARLTGLDVAEVVAVTGALNDAGLLAGGRFRHPAVRTAVVDEMSTVERRTLFVGAARLLHDRGAPAGEVAPYLVAAGDVDDGWTVPVLEAAAEDALRDERPEPAVRYLEFAHSVAAGEDARIRIVAKLARAERRVNPSAAARRLPALTVALKAGRLGDQDVVELTRQLLWHGRTDDAAEALEQARNARGDGTAAELRAVELWVACSHPPLARRGTGEPAGRDARPADLATGPRLKATGALAAVLGRGSHEHAVADAEQVLQALRPSDGTSWGVDAAVAALLTLTYADRLDVARSWCERLLGEPGTVVGQAMFAAVLAEVALRRGDLPTAFEQGSAALALMPRASWGAAIGLPLGSVVAAATRMGRHEEAAAILEPPVPEAMVQSRYGLHYLHARGLHYLAADRGYAALADFLSCGELMASWGLDVPGLVSWRLSAAEAWLRHGENRHEARRLVNEQLAKLGPSSSRTRGAALRLLAATGQLSSRPQLLTEAVTILEDCGDQFELARALADLSRTYQALREPRRAWTVARRAWRVANVCGAQALCAELLPSRTAEPERPEAADGGPIASLTDAERRVAALAAVGYTNREIAGKLFITPSTIEQHLTRVYRKLNVRYRDDLPTDLELYLPSSA